MLTGTSGFCLKQVRVISKVPDLVFASYFIAEKAVFAKPLIMSKFTLSVPRTSSHKGFIYPG